MKIKMGEGYIIEGDWLCGIVRPGIEKESGFVQAAEDADWITV